MVEVGQFETAKARAKRVKRAEKKALEKLQHDEAEMTRKNVQAYFLKACVYSGREFPRMDRFGAGRLGCVSQDILWVGERGEDASDHE